MNPDFVSWRERHRVRIGLILGILFVWRAQPRNILFLTAGFLVSIAGILLRQWAAGCLVKNDELVTRGPYAVVRNPLYLGSFLVGAGLVFASTSFSPIFNLRFPHLDRSLFFWASLWIMIDSIYLPKIEKEERLLSEKFGQSFSDYSREVPRILPKRLKIKRFDFSTFDLKLWKKNEEYWSIAVYLLICAFLIAGYFIR